MMVQRQALPVFSHRSVSPPISPLYSPNSVPVRVASHGPSCLPIYVCLPTHSAAHPPFLLLPGLPYIPECGHPCLCPCGCPSSHLFTDQLPPILPFLFLHNTHLLHLSSAHPSIQCPIHESYAPSLSLHIPLVTIYSSIPQSHCALISSYLPIPPPLHPSIQTWQLQACETLYLIQELLTCDVISHVEIQQPSGHNPKE